MKEKDSDLWIVKALLFNLRTFNVGCKRIILFHFTTTIKLGFLGK